MEQRVLNYLEAKITEHCNLRCSVCCNFGNIAKKEEYGLQYFENDFRRLNELGIKVKKLRLLGGEPLLSNNICEYINISRRYQPEADIHLVSNGLMIKEMPNNFFSILKKNNIQVQISNYPEPQNQDAINQSKLILKKNGLGYIEYKPDFFEIDYNFSDANADVEKIFRRCNAIYNIENVYRGRIYKCARPISLRHYDEKYGTSYADINGGFDIYNESVTADEIFEFLNHPTETCKYCTLYKGYAEWKHEEAKPEHWINDKNNLLLIDSYSVSDERLYKCLEKMKYLCLINEKNEIKLVNMNLKEIFKLSGFKINLFLSDIYNLEKLHFVTTIIKKIGLNFGGYVLAENEFKEWFDRKRDLIYDNLKDSLSKNEKLITIIFTTDEKRTLKELMPLIRRFRK